MLSGGVCTITKIILSKLVPRVTADILMQLGLSPMHVLAAMRPCEEQIVVVSGSNERDMPFVCTQIQLSFARIAD